MQLPIWLSVGKVRRRVVTELSTFGHDFDLVARPNDEWVAQVSKARLWPPTQSPEVQLAFDEHGTQGKKRRLQMAGKASARPQSLL